MEELQNHFILCQRSSFICEDVTYLSASGTFSTKGLVFSMREAREDTGRISEVALLGLITKHSPHKCSS